MYAVVHKDGLIGFLLPSLPPVYHLWQHCRDRREAEQSVICSLTVMQHNHVESSSKAMQD